MLKVERVTKRFGGLTAVSNVSFELAEGEVLGLIGPNGAGKTTLFNIISGTYMPDSGQILFQGKGIGGKAPHQICQMGIGRTFQIVKPFAQLSVVDNVKVGAFLRTNSSHEAEQKAREVVTFVDLKKYADTPARSLTTSGRKRLELARALATEPKLLLLDEVMAGLTPTESLEMVKLIRQIRAERGVTLLVIEHVMKAIMALSDRVAVLHHGELIAIDQPAAIASDPKVIEAYLGKEYRFAEN
ncbi:MAG: ABC transporter ATP-binding protein [Anaerolineae bacterium]|nr:MAG: ABC transporter ATP-binding protein [Anaerolineae bacterium]MCL4880016.1 ABC transporter ATP-binding protein [Anaerolineae bacterium]